MNDETEWWEKRPSAVKRAEAERLSRIERRLLANYEKLLIIGTSLKGSDSSVADYIAAAEAQDLKVKLLATDDESRRQFYGLYASLSHMVGVMFVDPVLDEIQLLPTEEF